MCTCCCFNVFIARPTLFGLCNPDMTRQADKKKEEKVEERVTLGPKVAEGENVFGVAHIFASFNDTFVVSNYFLGGRDNNTAYLQPNTLLLHFLAPYTRERPN